MAEVEEKYNPSNEKLHYDSLIKFFKFLVGAITILGGVAAWIIGGTLADLKRDLAEDLNRLKDEIRAMREESQQTIKESKEEADKQIDHLRKNTETFLSLTKDVTSMQIATLREEAGNLALSSARQRVEEAFKANNIQLLVESAAKQEIGNRLKEIVEQEIQRTTQVFDKFPVLTAMYDRIRWGDRSALDILDSLANHSENPIARQIARAYLLQKGIDYEEYIVEMNGGSISKVDPLVRLGIAASSLSTGVDTTRLRSILSDIILKDADLERVTYAFIGFRNLTGIDLKTFDISFVKQLKEKAR